MYFKDRKEVGDILAGKLGKYKSENCAVVALSKGSVLVGRQIARKLHANLMILMHEDINIPGEPDPIGAITSDDRFTYNYMYSIGEIEEFNMDYYSFIEQERINRLSHLHLLLGKRGEIKKSNLRHHVVILVSDGLNNGFSIDIAANFLGTISYKKLVIASAFATPNAYDLMRVVGDDVVNLNIIYNYLGVDHYYDNNEIPDIEELFKISDNISLDWKQ